jgi:hypothetical protein
VRQNQVLARSAIAETLRGTGKKVVYSEPPSKTCSVGLVLCSIAVDESYPFAPISPAIPTWKEFQTRVSTSTEFEIVGPQSALGIGA